MLDKVWIRNLACFDEQKHEVDFAPETVLIGPNNVGKSAFISGFNAVRTSYFVGSNFNWEMPNVYRWRSFQNIVHGHDVSRVIEASIDITGQNISGNLNIQLGQRSQAYNPQHHLVSRQMIEALGKIWYLSATRNDLPPELPVGSNPPYTPWRQPINPEGSNVIPFLLERFTTRDERWEEAENWLRRIAPESSLLKSPLRGNAASIEMTNQGLGTDINLAYQGTGIQKVLSVIASLVFSPPGTTLIVEEPEIHLHPRSQEAIVDLINLAVTKWEKQVIFTTHSWDMLLPFISDVGKGHARGEQHSKADASKFKLMVFDRVNKDGKQRIEISELDIKNMAFMDLRDYLKKLWG